jgi:hypothetical protein
MIGGENQHAFCFSIPSTIGDPLSVDPLIFILLVSRYPFAEAAWQFPDFNRFPIFKFQPDTEQKANPNQSRSDFHLSIEP